MCPPFLVRMKRVPPSLGYPRAHCYNTRQFTAEVAAIAFGRPVAGFGGGNHWKSLEKKQHRSRQTDRQLLLPLAPPIRLHAPMRLIWFFDGTKSEMIVIIASHTC